VGSIQFRVQLNDIQPAIWRSFQLDQEETFFDLHEVIQIVMGWENAHLFEFNVQNRRIGLMPEEEDLWDGDENVEDSEMIALSELTLTEGDKFRYTYDFGDSWEHTLTVEKILPHSTECPKCVGGARACPPEDVGGIPGYEGFLEAISDPNHPEHEDYIDWIEEYDAEEFNLEDVNEALMEFNDWRQDLFSEEEE
jgi:hypothetical protein